MSICIRVQLPFQLQRLANCPEEVQVVVAGLAPGVEPTQQQLISALEQQLPALRGAIIDPHTGRRRPLLRFFACQQDHSFLGLDSPLPAEVVTGREAFLIVGAISGG